MNRKCVITSLLFFLFYNSKIFSDDPTKIIVPINEAHAGLLETLQINNNKQLLPIPNPKLNCRFLFAFFIICFLFWLILANEKSIDVKQILNSHDAERYLTIETNRGILVINRKYE